MCNFMKETIFVKMRTKNIGLFAFMQSDKNRWQLNYDFHFSVRTFFLRTTFPRFRGYWNYRSTYMYVSKDESIESKSNFE